MAFSVPSYNRGMKRELTTPEMQQAVAQGVRNALFDLLQQTSNTPGRDTFQAIKIGVKEAAAEWLQEHTTLIIEEIGRRVTATK